MKPTPEQWAEVILERFPREIAATDQAIKYLNSQAATSPLAADIETLRIGRAKMVHILSQCRDCQTIDLTAINQLGQFLQREVNPRMASYMPVIEATGGLQ